MTANPHTRTARRIATVVALAALATLMGACGREDKEKAAVPAKPADKTSPAAAKAPSAAADPDSRLANAVATGKTAAGVDLKYDVAAKPDPGQDFGIELVFLPRLAAEALEVEVTGISGLDIVSGATARFQNVVAGERYPARVVARAEGQGLYYVGVSARMTTKIQTEARTFSVPVVVGTVAAPEKPVPVREASGQPIQSLPATETGREAQ